MKYIVYSFLVLFLYSCAGQNKEKIALILGEWQGKEIVFQRNPIFIQGNDTVDYLKQTKYKMLIYTDSIGCVGCKLRLGDWRRFMAYIGTITDEQIQFLFFFSHLSVAAVNNVLKDYEFKIPVCVDVKDSIGILNDFPKDLRYQTFLLDDKNRVLIVGNPIYNPQIGYLISDVLKGQGLKVRQSKKQTSVRLGSDILNFGKFMYRETKKKEQVIIQNVGDIPLIVNDIMTSCDCISIECDNSSVSPGEDFVLNISYQPKRSGYFEETVTVYCNSASSPLIIKVKGKCM